ncbi:MAG TPA: hypothetical protein VGB50_01290 [Flavobacterium sp.]|jgi:hypothetical protein
MKRILLFLILVSAPGYSQDILETLATETCECISKKGPAASMNAETLRNEFVSCFFQSYSDHAEEVDKVEKLELGNEEQMTNFGEKIALKMAKYCPETLMSLGNAVEAEEEEAKTLTIEGEIIEILNSDFVTIKVKDKNARVHSMLLMNYFDTASLFIDNQIKKKDRITVMYNEVEMFDPKLKEFRYFKIISGLSKK